MSERKVEWEKWLDGDLEVTVTEERDRLRVALERIDGMAGRPKCLCGRPTGTPAIRQCARAALEGK